MCERFFLPPKQELAALVASNARVLTLESQTPVGEFDVIAFSVSFEWDYVNVLTLLRLAGVPARAADRDARHPLVVVGGAVTFVNPEPLAPFADVIAAGEGEVLVPALGRAFSAAASRADLLGLLARERGFYIPSFYEPQYAPDGSIASYHLTPAAICRRAADRQEGGTRDDRRGRSAGDEHLHARYRVRIAVPRRSRARLREPVPLLLGRLQLPAGPGVSGRSDPRSSPKPRSRTRAGRGSSRSRSAITPRSTEFSPALLKWAIRSAPRRCGSTT